MSRSDSSGQDRLSKRRRYRRLSFGFAIGGTLGFVAAANAGYPLVGVGLYWLGFLAFVGVWHGTAVTLFDQHDVALERRASHITLNVIAGLAVGVGVFAGESGTALAVASVVAIVAAAVLAAGIGAVFPRFAAVDFAGARRAVPPSKVAYGVFSQALTLAVVAGAVVVDDSVRELSAVVLSAWLPFGLTVSVDTLATGSWIVLGCVAVAVPIAYRVAVKRVNDYRLA